MSAILKSLVGSKVKVYTGDQGGCTDEGIVEDADDSVLVVRSKTDTLVFPLYNVRLIKIVR